MLAGCVLTEAKPSGAIPQSRTSALHLTRVGSGPRSRRSDAAHRTMLRSDPCHAARFRRCRRCPRCRSRQWLARRPETRRVPSATDRYLEPGRSVAPRTSIASIDSTYRSSNRPIFSAAAMASASGAPVGHGLFGQHFDPRLDPGWARLSASRCDRSSVVSQCLLVCCSAGKKRTAEPILGKGRAWRISPRQRRPKPWPASWSE